VVAIKSPDVPPINAVITQSFTAKAAALTKACAVFTLSVPLIAATKATFAVAKSVPTDISPSALAVPLGTKV